MMFGNYLLIGTFIYFDINYTPSNNSMCAGPSHNEASYSPPIVAYFLKTEV